VVDVGANDGFGGSNSYGFIARGWRAILIEPHPGPFAKLQARYRDHPRVRCLNCACGETEGCQPLFEGKDGAEGTLSTLRDDDNPHVRQSRTDKRIPVQVRRLDGLLAELKAPRDFGVLSIDTEGYDYRVLLGLDLGLWRPGVIMTESYFDNEQKFAYLRQHGYELRTEVGANTVWAPSDQRRPTESGRGLSWKDT
jgi:FkbM family methyltransferase